MVEEICVQIRVMTNPQKSMRALADVEFILNERQGSIKVCGYRIMVADGSALWVSPPARQGKAAWFEVVTVRGPIEGLLISRILEEFALAQKMGATTNRSQ